MTPEQRKNVANLIKSIENDNHFLQNNQLEEFYKEAEFYIAFQRDMSFFTEFFIENGVNVLTYLKQIIPNYCFHGLDLQEKNIIFPQGLRSIGERAFCNTNIESVVIPDSLFGIDDYAFTQCDYLHNIRIEGNPDLCQGCFHRPGDEPMYDFDTYTDITFECANDKFYESMKHFVENNYIVGEWKVVKI